MPFAPPVTIAVRPASLAIGSSLPGYETDEFLEAFELQLDHVLGRLILQLQGLVVELLRRERHNDLRPAEQDRIDRCQRLPQMILHARGAKQAACARLPH